MSAPADDAARDASLPTSRPTKRAPLEPVDVPPVPRRDTTGSSVACADRHATRVDLDEESSASLRISRPRELVDERVQLLARHFGVFVFEECDLMTGVSSPKRTALASAE